MAAPSNQILQSAVQPLLTREELKAMDYRTLVNMDKMYSFTKSRKTAKTNMETHAIITRLLRNRVRKSKFAPQHAAYLHYELNHPIAKALPVYQLTEEEIEKGLMVQPTEGTFLPPYLVGEIYTRAKTMEDRDAEIAFIKKLFEPETLSPRKNSFHSSKNSFDVTLNTGFRFSIRLGEIHFKNVFSPTFFIKDYSYLARKFAINSALLKERAQYSVDVRGDNGPQPAFTRITPRVAIYENYAHFKENQIGKFFKTHLFPIYALYYVIKHVLGQLEWRATVFRVMTSKDNNISQEYADTRLKEDYLAGLQNKPINVLKVYIRELNERLDKLKDYKIIINNDDVKDLNMRLDAINNYLVNPDPSIPNQANAKFDERVISIIMKPTNERFEKRGPIKTIKATKSMFNKYASKEDGLKKTIKRHHSARRHSRSKNSSRRIKSI